MYNIYNGPVLFTSSYIFKYVHIEELEGLELQGEKYFYPAKGLMCLEI